jgi:hypothetical protein
VLAQHESLYHLPKLVYVVRLHVQRSRNLPDYTEQGSGASSLDQIDRARRNVCLAGKLTDCEKPLNSDLA